jgi:hypothetical protein
MALSWTKRKARLSSLLDIQGDGDSEGLALDRILHGQSIIGKTCESSWTDLSTPIIDATYSKNCGDRRVTLHGQRSGRCGDARLWTIWCRMSFCLLTHDVISYHRVQIDVVTCHLDGHVYVRKSIEKRYALKTRDVSPSPLHLRSLLTTISTAMLTSART